MHPDWLIPDWPAPASVRALFTTRAGGTSAVPYDSMNLGDHVGDVPERVPQASAGGPGRNAHSRTAMRSGRWATPTGLEPAASAVTGRRANQLRYGARCAAHRCATEEL